MSRHYAYLCSSSNITSQRVFPDWLPFHPHKWWIHTRTVYIPMAYLYGIRYKMEENDLILALREVGVRIYILFIAHISP